MDGEVNHERLWTLKNNLRVLKGRRVGGWGSQVVGIKEGMFCMEHWVWCKNNEFCYAEQKLKKKKKSNLILIRPNSVNIVQKLSFI